MPRPVTWFRLYRGRVWHVRAGEVGALLERALCGTEPYSGEELEERPPWGGKPCPECLAVAHRMVEAGIEAGAAWSARQYSPDDVVDAEILALCGSLDRDHSCCQEDEHLCSTGCPCAAAEAEADAINAAEVAHLVDPQPESMDLVRHLADAIGRAQAFKAAVAEIPGVEVE